MLVQKNLQSFLAKQRSIAAKDHRMTVKTLQMLPAAQNGMACAALFGLLDEDQIPLAAVAAHDLIFAVADHDENAFCSGGSAGLDHILEHRPSAYLMQYLRQTGIHPGTLPGRQHYSNAFIRLGHIIKFLIFS